MKLEWGEFLQAKICQKASRKAKQTTLQDENSEVWV